MTLTMSDEKQRIAAAFGRAAMGYDALADYQQATGHQLLQLLDNARAQHSLHQSQKILDAGCGTGFFSQILQQKGAKVTALDLSEGMLSVAKSKQAASDYICADIESLPYAAQTFDVVFSNLSIQWCKNLHLALCELYRVTKSGGLIVFTTLAQDSLQELSTAWQSLDGCLHVNRFLAYQQMSESCETWRYQLSVQQDTLYFASLNQLLNSVKGIGATHLHEGRRKGLMTRQRLQQLASVYPSNERGFPLTYHTVFGVIYRD